MPESVLALDPGGRTGWAAAVMDVNALHLTNTGVYEQTIMALKLAAWQGVVGRNGGSLDRQFDTLVTESWRPRRKNGSMDWIESDPLLSAQHVGQIRLIAGLSGARYVEYAPSQKPVWTASMPPSLKRLDEYSNEQHDQDARWHLWGYFMENWLDLSLLKGDDMDQVVV